MKDGTLQSHVEVEKYLGVYRKMLADFSELYPLLARSFERDLQTIVRRTAAEGIRFLTEVLPRIGKMLDQATSGKTFQPIPGLAQDPGWTHPRLFGGLLRLVLDREGKLHPDAQPKAVQCLRQVTLLLYKLDFPLDPKLSEQTIARFVQIEEEELVHGVPYASSRELDEARKLLRDVFRSFNPKDIIPQHGPGAVATKEVDEDKWKFKRLYKSIHSVYPYYEYFVVGSHMLLDKVDWYRNLARHDYPVARVTTVPKDSRGPRIISMEPLELQFMQQGLLRRLVPFIESSPLTRGHVNFTDQSINRSLAKSASLTQEWATLDMKDASDRVSEDLVWWLFAECEELRKCFLALRSKATILPDGRVLKLRKFAPMGSAICFPVEALCFWALAVVALRKQGMGMQPALASVYVYGDDIIVPTEHAEAVSTMLESVCLKVNRDKSCSGGYFRESCGMDAFKGEDVTPVRIKHRWSQRPSNGSVFLHYVSIGNSLWVRGFKHAARFVWDCVEHVYGKLPVAPDPTYFPCRVDSDSWEESFSRNLERGIPIRWSVQYHRFEIKCLRAVTRTRTTTLDGWERCLRNLCSGPGDAPDEVHLSKRCQIRRRWSAFHREAPLGFNPSDPRID